METSRYTLFNQDIVDQLKLLGYNSVQLVLLNSGNVLQATIEVKPLKATSFGIDIISLHSIEIQDYLNSHSPMAKYVIDQDYLTDSDSH